MIELVRLGSGCCDQYVDRVAAGRSYRQRWRSQGMSSWGDGWGDGHLLFHTRTSFEP
ncbi:MAG: hypothetical protein M1546_15490 [Chloroflexi bacterium]|nr:hypothetical protein [Chloroflexota bacterium]